MIKNNIEMDVKMKCIESQITQSDLAAKVGTSPSYINKLIRGKEPIINKSFVSMMEELGYDVRLTYEKRDT